MAMVDADALHEAVDTPLILKLAFASVGVLGDPLKSSGLKVQ